jgi:hypothetical protein
VDDAWQAVEPDDENMIRFDSGVRQPSLHCPHDHPLSIGMDCGFPTGIAVSYNGVKPVYSDESPQPIILSLSTDGLLCAHHFLDRSRSNDLLSAAEELPSGTLRDLLFIDVNISPTKSSEPSEKKDKSLESKFGGLLSLSVLLLNTPSPILLSDLNFFIWTIIIFFANYIDDTEELRTRGKDFPLW